jgi:hypothetical protein
MFNPTYKRPLAILAVAGGLIVGAAGPANASPHTAAQGTPATSLKVTMEDILVTSVKATTEQPKVTRVQTGTSSRRAHRRGRRHHAGKGGGVTATYDVRGQDHI